MTAFPQNRLVYTLFQMIMKLLSIFFFVIEYLSLELNVCLVPPALTLRIGPVQGLGFRVKCLPCASCPDLAKRSGVLNQLYTLCMQSCMYPPPQRMQSLYYMLNQLYTLCMQSCMYPPPQRMQSLYYMLTYDTNTYVCTLVCIYLYYIICSHMTQIHKCVHLCVYTCVCISDEGFINA